MDKIIAQVELIAIYSSGNEVDIKIEVGEPQSTGDEYRCPVAIHGLHDHLSAIRGDDSFSSLCLALGLIRRLLSDFQSKGGRLFFPGESDEYNDDLAIDLLAMWDMQKAEGKGVRKGSP